MSAEGIGSAVKPASCVFSCLQDKPFFHASEVFRNSTVRGGGMMVCFLPLLRSNRRFRLIREDNQCVHLVCTKVHPWECAQSPS